MSQAESSPLATLPAFPVDLGWRNFVFAVRTAGAGTLSLAIAYWLELRDPQWAALTVYLLAQPTAGAAVAKGAWRIVGTLSGAVAGLIIVAFYAQAPVPLVASLASFLGLTIYAGGRLRNFPSYGFMLAGYTALLVGFEGAADPMSAWTIAADRTAEIVIGIGCVTGASLLILPRYAGDVLRESLARTFSGLAGYGATALRPGMPAATFSALRRHMVEEVVKFDALRSYTLFEAPELRADEAALGRSVREFLRVLAIARGLYVRVDLAQKGVSGPVVDRLRDALDDARGTLLSIASDGAPISIPGASVAVPSSARAALLAARMALGRAAAELEAMAGTVPFDPLANALLVVRRAGDLLHGLSLVAVSEAASLRARRPPTIMSRPPPTSPANRGEALLGALRAALSVVLVSGFWLATGWDQGFSALSGAAIMLFFSVNQDDPGRIAWPFVQATAAGQLAALAAMVLVLPWIEGFAALALFLMVALIPAGLMVGTPRYAWAGIAFGGFFIAQLGTGNVFQPDVLTFINSGLALIMGMAVCLLMVRLLPVNSSATRMHLWTTVLRDALPAAARGARPERRIVNEVLAMLAALLPRLDLSQDREDILLRGTLGASSSCLELGRLRRQMDDPAMPPSARTAIAACLDALTAAYAELPASAGRERVVGMAEAAVEQAHAALAALPLTSGSPAAGTVVRAGASLRFIADRFGIDRAFYLGTFRTDESGIARMNPAGTFGFHTLDLFGFYLPPLMLWAAIAVLPFLLLRWILRLAGFYRLVWHRALFDVSLYVIILGSLILAGGNG